MQPSVKVYVVVYLIPRPVLVETLDDELVVAHLKALVDELVKFVDAIEVFKPRCSLSECFNGKVHGS